MKLTFVSCFYETLRFTNLKFGVLMYNVYSNQISGVYFLFHFQHCLQDTRNNLIHISNIVVVVFSDRVLLNNRTQRLTCFQIYIKVPTSHP